MILRHIFIRNFSNIGKHGLIPSGSIGVTKYSILYRTISQYDTDKPLLPITKIAPPDKSTTSLPSLLINTIRNGHYTIQQHQYGNIIELHQYNWLGLRSNKLFIRQFYDNIVINMMKNFTNTDKQRFIVLGSPGISKTGFGNYLLFCALKLKKDIIYANGIVETILVLTYNRESDSYTVDRGNIHDSHIYSKMETLLDFSSTVFISDSMATTPARNAFTILITSPNVTRWKRFSTDSPSITSKVVFNPFTRKKLFTLRETCYLCISETTVNNKFYRWGGNARSIFEISESEDPSEFEQILGSQQLSVNHLVNMRNLKLELPVNETGHQLFHLTTSGYAKENFDVTLFEKSSFYQFKEICIASEEFCKTISREI